MNPATIDSLDRLNRSKTFISKVGTNRNARSSHRSGIMAQEDHPPQNLHRQGNSVIPDEVKRLIDRSIKSIWALELLLFLRQHAGESWTAERLTTELRSSTGVVYSVVPILVRDGFVEENNGGFRYVAKGDLDAAVVALDRFYKERPVTVVRAIALALDDHVRTLADAFRFRKD